MVTPLGILWTALRAAFRSRRDLVLVNLVFRSYQAGRIVTIQLPFGAESLDVSDLGHQHRAVFQPDARVGAFLAMFLRVEA